MDAGWARSALKMDPHKDDAEKAADRDKKVAAHVKNAVKLLLDGVDIIGLTLDHDQLPADRRNEVLSGLRALLDRLDGSVGVSA